MRKKVDWIYRISGWLAVLLLIAIGVLTVAQVAARLAGTIVPSADDFATFAMAASIFLGLAYTYRLGGHVRVRLVQQRVSAPARRWIEAGCLATAAAMIAYLLWFTLDMILTTYQMNEYTLGLVPIRKWIPMSFMLMGFLVLLVAAADDLVAVLLQRNPSYAAAEETQALPSVMAE